MLHLQLTATCESGVAMQHYNIMRVATLSLKELNHGSHFFCEGILIDINLKRSKNKT